MVVNDYAILAGEIASGRESLNDEEITVAKTFVSVVGVFSARDLPSGSRERNDASRIYKGRSRSTRFLHRP